MPFLNRTPQIDPIDYNDRYLRIALCLVAAHIIVLYNEDHTFFQALFTFSYWRGLLGSFVIATLLVNYIHWVTVRLDKRFDWHADTLNRLLWQLLIGFFAPALFAFLLAAFFFGIFGKNILETTYLQQDYTLVVTMLLTMNLYYFGLNSFLRLKSSSANDRVQEPLAGKEPERRDNGKEILVVNTPTVSVPLRPENISYCYLLQNCVFVRTADMKTLSESYQIAGSLKELEAKLDRRMFFRINRQMIINFNACGSYRPGKNKTLEVFPDPAPYEKGTKIPDQHKRLCMVSEDRVAAFRLWMDR
ncbi:LytTR family DNA-binding domain-containing protein [Pedobacter sp. ASV28]|uniref:LytR/AlgR family response regulator transcription factor n=1 Tax=Pedobacter sp. ASV28 TaxID=2795123 RepID=UPI0018ECCE66|nr:LytTR family DNA-binding domain-containing protein [Pedobacter sp. ASV28]